MSGEYLLDTNAAIAFLKGDSDLIELLKQGQENVFTSLVTVGELHFGAEKSHQVEENRSQIERLTRAFVVLIPTLETARYYGQIKNRLRVKGRPIPENDIWVSAIAMEHKLAVLTRDNHFEEVEELLFASW